MRERKKKELKKKKEELQKQREPKERKTIEVLDLVESPDPDW